MEEPTEHRFTSGRVQTGRHRRLQSMGTRIPPMALLAALLVTQCGCMGVYTVRNAGTHWRALEPKAIWRDSSGQIMLECSLSDRNELTRPDDLGTRFVCASAATWRQAAETEFASQLQSARHTPNARNIDHIYIRPSASLATGDPVALFSDGFVLYPPDVTGTGKATPPTPGWERQLPSPRFAAPSFTMEIDGQAITVYVDEASLVAEASSHKRWWWYPNQALLLPAFALDVVTFPIQFFIVMDQLSKIGA